MILSDILAAEHITDTIKGMVLYYIYEKSCIATALVLGKKSTTPSLHVVYLE